MRRHRHFWVGSSPVCSLLQEFLAEAVCSSQLIKKKGEPNKREQVSPTFKGTFSFLFAISVFTKSCTLFSMLFSCYTLNKTLYSRAFEHSMLHHKHKLNKGTVLSNYRSRVENFNSGAWKLFIYFICWFFWIVAGNRNEIYAEGENENGNEIKSHGSNKACITRSMWMR